MPLKNHVTFLLAGLLQIAAKMPNASHAILAFHSLKR